MRKRVLLLVVMLSFVAGIAYSQSRTVSGTVADESGASIPNASVLVKGTNLGTITNSQGTFTLQVPSKSTTLIVSAVNMMDKEFELGENNMISITLTRAQNSLAL